MSVKMFLNAVKFNGDANMASAIRGEQGIPGRDGVAVADEHVKNALYDGLAPYISAPENARSVTSAAGVVRNLKLWGASGQPGTPSPTNPARIANTDVALALNGETARSPYKLRGFPVPSGGNIEFSGMSVLSDVFDLEAKTITRYVGAMTGAEAAKYDWYAHSKGFYFEPKNVRDMGNSADQRVNLVMSDYYPARSWTNISSVDKGCCGYYGAMVMVRDTAYGNVNDFVNSIKDFDGDFLVYPLKNPVVIELRDSEVAEFKSLYFADGDTGVTHNGLKCAFDYPVDRATYADHMTDDDWHFVYYTKAAESNAVNLPFATPEDFGAVGNGAADDSDALQAAVDSGRAIIGSGDYLISKTLRISGNMRPEVRLTGKLTYTGTGSAIEISNAIAVSVYVKDIEALSGTGISMIADLGRKYCQYNTVEFKNIKAKDHGIFIQARDYYWCNANIFRGGRIRSDSYVVYVDGDAGEMFSNAEGNLFDGISFEGNPLGFYFNKGDSETLFNVRCSYTENDHFITTEGHCDTLSIIGGHICSEDMLVLSNETSGTIYGVELRSEEQDYSSNTFHHYAILRGVIYASRMASYKSLSPDAAGTVRLTSVMADAPNAIQLTDNCKELVLSRQYGDVPGINDIAIRVNFSAANNGAVVIRDSEGNAIVTVRREGSESFRMVKLEWYKQFGWAYSFPTFANVE